MIKSQRLAAAEPAIAEAFEALRSKILTLAQLRQLLAANRKSWGLPRRITTEDVTAYLARRRLLREHVLKSPEYQSQTVTRYSYGDATPLEIALSTRPRAYLSHATAAGLHKLIRLDRGSIYLNFEQSKKKASDNAIEQHAIDNAFANKPRTTALVLEYGDITIIPINGKHTDRYGVESIKGPRGEQLDVTSLERTLVDMVVRPNYAGGANAILKAFKAARGKLSVEKLVSTIKALDHRYPFHQTIGFMMQRAKYPSDSHNALRALGLKYNFYVENQMEEPSFSADWKLFYPRDL